MRHEKIEYMLKSMQNLIAMINLFGTAHVMQLDPSGGLRNVLIKYIHQLKPKYIIEEWNDDSLDYWNQKLGTSYKTSIAEYVAHSFNLHYRAIELSKTEQLQEGFRPEPTMCGNALDRIDNSSLNRSRENLIKQWKIEFIIDRQKAEEFWWEKIKDISAEDMIFITGLDHIYPFNLKLWATFDISQTDLPPNIYGINKLLKDKRLPINIIKETIPDIPEFITLYHQQERRNYPCDFYLSDYYTDDKIGL